jgi:hypothetical protein
MALFSTVVATYGILHGMVTGDPSLSGAALVATSFSFLYCKKIWTPDNKHYIRSFLDANTCYEFPELSNHAVRGALIGMCAAHALGRINVSDNSVCFALNQPPPSLLFSTLTPAACLWFGTTDLCYCSHKNRYRGVGSVHFHPDISDQNIATSDIYHGSSHSALGNAALPSIETRNIPAMNYHNYHTRTDDVQNFKDHINTNPALIIYNTMRLGLIFGQAFRPSSIDFLSSRNLAYCAATGIGSIGAGMLIDHVTSDYRENNHWAVMYNFSGKEELPEKLRREQQEREEKWQRDYADSQLSQKILKNSDDKVLQTF